MVVLLLIIAFVIISTVLVIAAGILSSRMSRQEEWYETYEETDTVSAEAIRPAIE